MTGHNGQRGSAAVAALAGLLAVVLLSAVGVAALRSGTADADTVVTRPGDAVLVLADGTRRDAREGEAVPRGATVRSATLPVTLTTRGRDVWLGQATDLTVVDGVRQVLGAGFVVVDADEGPGVEVRTDAAVVTTAEDSVVRVVAGPVARVGVLRGEAASVTAAGRRAETSVPAYYQAQVAGGALPTAPTPLLLTGDAYERDLAAELHNADRDLNALARRLDGAGSAGPAVVQVLQSVVPAAPLVAGAPESERALGFLLAAATAPDRAAEGYAEVRALRTAGGSWGVVAALVGVTPGDVSGVLSSLLDPGAPALAGGPLDPDLVLGALLDPPGDGGAVPTSAPTDPQQPRDEPAPAPSDGPDGPDGPGPSPSPSPTRPQTGVPVVDEVVDTVLDLLDPVTGPLLPPAPRGGTPSPAPLVELDLSLLD